MAYTMYMYFTVHAEYTCIDGSVAVHVLVLSSSSIPRFTGTLSCSLPRDLFPQSCKLHSSGFPSSSSMVACMCVLRCVLQMRRATDPMIDDARALTLSVNCIPKRDLTIAIYIYIYIHVCMQMQIENSAHTARIVALH